MRSIRWAISGIAFLLSAPIGAAPSVTLDAPGTGVRYVAPATIELVASPVVDPGRSIARVEFLADGEIIATATQAPYAFTWTNVAHGNYALRARVFDSQGRRDLSPAVRVRVRDNRAPHVRILTPDNRDTFPAPTSIAVSLRANDRDDNLTSVELFANGASLATFTAAPYEFNWADVPPGTYALTARATDDLGLTTTSRTVNITVTGSQPNVPPTVSLTSPAPNASFNAPAAIPLSAAAADSDGTVARVDFFFGSTLIATRTEAPYDIIWTSVPEGAYALTALVTDNAGASISSSPVNVTVTRHEAKLYFIHVDHLNTPRLIADEAQRVVWRWEQAEPFGNNVPDENPSGLGTFEFPGRLPGQYFDRETNLYYNYTRDYDPTIGRYEQSDPIGLQAGINTFAYVIGNPLSYFDPFGLVKVCYFSDAAGGFGHIGYGIESETKTSSYYATGNVFGSPGEIQEDLQKIKECKVIPSDLDQDNCLLACRARRKANPGWYSLTTNNCTDFVRDCLVECGVIKSAPVGSPPRRTYLLLPGKSQ